MEILQNIGSLFLQAIGAIVVIVVLAVVGIYAYIKIKLGKFSSAAASASQTPLIIHLNEDFAPEWMNQKAAKGHTTALQQLGFVQGGAYKIPEMDGVRLTAFFKPPLVAVLYHHPLAGNWVDMGFDTKDGREISVTSAPTGEDIDARPEKELHYLKGESVERLYGLISEKCSQHECAEYNPTDFRKHFESVYKKDIAWRNRRGGLSYREFEATAIKSDPMASEKQKMKAFLEMKETELRQWETAAIHEYQKKYNISDDEIEEQSGWFFIVPFRTDPRAFINYLYDREILQDDDRSAVIKTFAAERDVFKIFERLNQSLSPDLRPEHLANLDHPLPCKLFRQTLGPEDS